ncbi:MAG: exo-beta-N-acetylmuramidase NamZ domain-containing protein [Gemmatimonas sp.]
MSSILNRPPARLVARSLALLAVFAMSVTSLPAQSRAGNVVPGIEVLLSDSMHLIRGKRVGLLTNHSGRDRKGTSTIDLLFNAPGVKLTALYGPEHGIRGDAKAGEKISSGVDAKTGVKVYSLYGAVESPTADMLKDIDVLLYDIQDVGARVYTYQWTLALTAASAGKPIIVLDRPNPIRADRFEGNILDLRFRSLVGQHAVALRYGLTPGELMRFLVGTKALNASVTVIPMKHYTRAMWFDQTGIPRVNPSPNLRTLDAELLYPGTVFFEGTNATEGRGTDAPFQLIGADYLTDHVAVAASLNAMKLPGVRFDTATRTIEAGYKFGGKTIPMIKVSVTDRNAVRPVELGIRMLRAFYAAHPTQFTWREPTVNAAGRIKGIDRLAGTDRLTKAVEAGTVDALVTQWDADAVKFAAQVKPYLLYR